MAMAGSFTIPQNFKNRENSTFSNLNGRYGSFDDTTYLLVKGFNEVFRIVRSFPVLVAENSFTNVYHLASLTSRTFVVTPSAFVSVLTDSISEEVLNNPSSVENLASNYLDGSLGSFPDKTYVKTKFSDTIYSVVASFLMLNSENEHIICYELKNIYDNSILYCPHSFLTRCFEPDSYINSIDIMRSSMEEGF